MDVGTPTPESEIVRLAREYVRKKHGVFYAPHRVVMEFSADGDHMRTCVEVSEHKGFGVPPIPPQMFLPTKFQKSMLDALDGRALRSDALGDAVGDRSRVFREPGGVKELVRYGLVAHHKTIGYYRPDAPPPDLRDQLV